MGKEVMSFKLWEDFAAMFLKVNKEIADLLHHPVVKAKGARADKIYKLIDRWKKYRNYFDCEYHKDVYKGKDLFYPMTPLMMMQQKHIKNLVAQKETGKG